MQNSGELELYVTGISEKATSTQVFNYFWTFSDDVYDVELRPCRQQGQQNAVVKFTRPDTISNVIDAVNFRKIDGFLLKCHRNTEESHKAIKEDDLNIALHFPRDFNMKTVTHRWVFEQMSQFGPILNIGIFNGFALCHFANASSVRKAFAARLSNGLTIKPKKAKIPHSQNEGQKRIKS